MVTFFSLQSYIRDLIWSGPLTLLSSLRFKEGEKRRERVYMCSAATCYYPSSSASFVVSVFFFWRGRGFLLKREAGLRGGLDWIVLL
jgi:hypothetical protein